MTLDKSARKRWLVTGAAGLLGQELVHHLRRSGALVAGLKHQDLDVTNPAAIREAFGRIRPHVVVNCAAWTRVDAAEAHEAEALAVNGLGPANLAAACSASTLLVQVSTDYVFDGAARRPYAEDTVPRPRTAYGRTKLAGEAAVLQLSGQRGYVVRTAWLYGAHGSNFVRRMIRLERSGQPVEVVDDQYGQPTCSADVSSQIVHLIRSGAPPGIYHATSSGGTTWCGLARQVFRLLGANPARVKSISSSAISTPATRPSYSALGHDAWLRVGITPICDWRTALGRAFPVLIDAEGIGSQGSRYAGLDNYT